MLGPGPSTAGSQWIPWRVNFEDEIIYPLSIPGFRQAGCKGRLGIQAPQTSNPHPMGWLTEKPVEKPGWWPSPYPKDPWDWYIYLHLVDFYGKCTEIYHTWILWAIQKQLKKSAFLVNT